MSESLEVKVARHDEKLEDHERRIRSQELNSKALLEISEYVKLQTIHNERQEKQFENMTQIMQNMQKDVTVLKTDMGYVKSNVDSVSNEVDELKEDKLNQSNKFKDRSIDFYLKLIGGVALAGLVLWLGLR